MIFRFNVLICAVILWCYQWNVPISTIDRSLLCIVLFWFISIYTCINEFEFFWYTFSPATVMRKGLQFPYLVKMNCFNLVHAFFQVWFSVQHVFCCNVTDLHIQKSTRHYQLLQHTLWMTTVSDSTKYTYQNICITREKENQRTREERLAYKE